jgi:hypothetical protein
MTVKEGNLTWKRYTTPSVTRWSKEDIVLG